MENAELRDLVQGLAEAFKEVPKPDPLASFEGSYDDEEVEVFNRTDWEVATYSDFCRGLEGWIVCPPETRAYLTPRLLRMLLLGQDGQHEGAADNLSFELLPHLEKPDVFCLFNATQMSAVLKAVAYVDRTRWHPNGGGKASDLARCWGLKGV